MPKVYMITANTILGEYKESVREVEAKETTNSLIWPGRRLNKFKDVDSYTTGELVDSVRVYTLDEAKIPGHLAEIRKRIHENLHQIAKQASDIKTQLETVMVLVPPEEWKTHFMIKKEE